MMKKLFSFLAIVSIIFASNCSRIPENDDPVIGIWLDVQIENVEPVGKNTVQKEWIFNDVYLGRFHTTINGSLEVISDFKWSEKDGVYTISYPALDNKTDDVVRMNEDSTGKMVLETENGVILAIRQ